MVFDINRIISGILILFPIVVSYIFNLDIAFLISIFFLILYDLFYSKIVSFNWSLIFYLILFIILFYLNFNYNLFFIFFASLFLSIFIRNHIHFFFIIILFIFLITSYNLILTDRYLFYSIIILSFINDTSAFIFGKIIRGPLITPTISPKKTISGTLISFLISLLILILFFKVNFLFSIFISATFFLGDIFFSYIKRSYKLKDFSNLLSGHGGILDRLDSVVIPIILMTLYTSIYAN